MNGPHQASQSSSRASADILHVVDGHGDRFVVMFPCERCGAHQRYCFVEHTAKCASCDGSHGVRDVTVG